MMYHVDLQGEMIYEKLNLREERIDLLQNPLLGPLLRRKEKLLSDDLLIKRANQLAIYYLNINKRYDLDVRKQIQVKFTILIELPPLQTNRNHGLGTLWLLLVHVSHRACRHIQKRTILAKTRLLLQLGEKDG